MRTRGEKNLPEKSRSELDALESSCRLNYAICKAKHEDWQVALEQAEKVLTFGPNAKASFRVGQALHKMGRHAEALPHLETASKTLTSDPTGEPQPLTLGDTGT